MQATLCVFANKLALRCVVYVGFLCGSILLIWAGITRLAYYLCRRYPRPNAVYDLCTHSKLLDVFAASRYLSALQWATLIGFWMLVKIERRVFFYDLRGMTTSIENANEDCWKPGVL